MTEPYRIPQCPSCLRRGGGHAPKCPLDPKPSADLRALLAAYVELRRNCADLEELIERPSGAEDLTADDLKRLDKAVTVMKVGFKMVKKVLRTHTVVGTKSWRTEDAPSPTQQQDAKPCSRCDAPPGTQHSSSCTHGLDAPGEDRQP